MMNDELAAIIGTFEEFAEWFHGKYWIVKRVIKLQAYEFKKRNLKVNE